jgi:Cu/Ag efflux pump CusA
VPWLESIRSQSVTGLSSIVLTFKRGTDIMAARQMMQERLTLAYTLPNVAHPPVILQPLSATARFMMIGVSSARVEPTELSLLARWTVKPRLLGVPGVANVAIWGQRLQQMHVHIDPNRLREARVTQDDIIAAAGDALWVSPLTFLKGSAPGTGGWIDNHNQRLTVQHAMPIATPEDMAKVALAPAYLLLSGKTMALGDLTEQTFAYPPLIGDAVIKNGNGLMLVIEKFPGANTLEVTRGVDQALAELKRGLPGVEIDAGVFRLADYVDDSIANLSAAIVVGAVLVMLVTGAFLSGWRSAAISLMAMALTLSSALIALHLTGATINTMVLAGLVVAAGVVIDDAVVDVDTLRARLRARAPGSAEPLVRSILEATRASRRDALYATLIVLLAVMPVFFMGGVAGAFFEPLALSYVLAVVASMVVALTVTPALSLMLLRAAPDAERESRIAGWIGRRYDALLRRVIGAPRKVFAGALLAAAAAAAVWPLLGQSRAAAQGARTAGHWATLPGTSHPGRTASPAGSAPSCASCPGCARSAPTSGAPSPATRWSASIRARSGSASTRPPTTGARWPRSARRSTAIRASTAACRPICATRSAKCSPARAARWWCASTASSATCCAARPRRSGRRCRASGAWSTCRPRARPRSRRCTSVNLDAAGRANVKPGDVRRASSTVFSGLTVGYLFKEQKIFEVVVWGTPESRHSLGNLGDLWVDKSDRTQARLGDVAAVSIVSTPTVIRHEQIAPYVDVVANVAGRSPGAVADEVEDKLEAISFPLEYHPEILGEYAERQSAERRMLGAGLAAVAGIFLLLQACFELAAGADRLAGAAGVDRRRHARRNRQRRRDFARLDRRLPRGAGHFGAQRRPADQSLPAPRTRRHAVRPRTGAARHARTSLADRRQRRRDRRRAAADRRLRLAARPRNRAADRVRHHRRADRRHAGDAVRHPAAVPGRGRARPALELDLAGA